MTALWQQFVSASRGPHVPTAYISPNLDFPLHANFQELRLSNPQELLDLITADK